MDEIVNRCHDCPNSEDWVRFKDHVSQGNAYRTTIITSVITIIGSIIVFMVSYGALQHSVSMIDKSVNKLCDTQGILKDKVQRLEILNEGTK